jgi:hypothetical protein
LPILALDDPLLGIHPLSQRESAVNSGDYLFFLLTWNFCGFLSIQIFWTFSAQIETV